MGIGQKFERHHLPYVWERHSFTGKRWPRNRVVRSFLLLVPWINLMAFAVLSFCLMRQTLVQPGRVLELPKGRQEDGLLLNCPAAIVKRLEAPGRTGVTVLLLDEGRYASDNPTELDALMRARPGAEVNLLVDVQVPYGEAVQWIERLKACGVARVNLVTLDASAQPEDKSR